MNVRAESWFAEPGLLIYQPGAGDWGGYFDAVARLGPHAVDRGLDAAVAPLLNWREVTDEQFGLGTVTGVPYRVIDKATIGFEVDIPEAQYELHFLSSSHVANGRQTSAGRHEPLKGGISISNEWSYGYGTLGPGWRRYRELS